MKTVSKPQPRKFHSSAIIRNCLYMFGGIFENYQPINRIQFMDLSMVKEGNTDSVEDNVFEWRKVQLGMNQANSIGRWGHVSKVYDDCVYIFGGRNTNELNDLLVFNSKNNSLKKLPTQKPPEARRKPCVWMIGSILIINSGYNGNYLCDQFWIDVKSTKQSFNKSLTISSSSNVQRKELCDIHINTLDNKYIDLSSKMIRNSFQS